MYKLKIMNYQPYEYELLQKTLDDLGQQGYRCNDLSYLSVFKKEKYPIYYKIDFFKPEGRSNFEKKVSRERFYGDYTKKDYRSIYKKRDMNVFMSKKELPSSPQNNLETIITKRRQKSLSFFFLLFLITSFLILFVRESYTIHSYLTYGITFVYIGAFVFLLSALYRQLTSFYCYQRLHKQKELFVSQIKKYRKIYIVLISLSITMFVGGLIEDYTNASSITINDYKGILLKDIGINKASDFLAQKQSSFTVPHYTSALEVIDDDIALSTRQYQFNSTQKADDLMEQFLNNPHDYLCTKVEKKQNILYGYRQDNLSTLIIQKDKTVISLAFNYEVSPQQIQQMIDFYS